MCNSCLFLCRNSQIPWKGLKLDIGNGLALFLSSPELPNSLEGIETIALSTEKKPVLSRNSQIPWKGLKLSDTEPINQKDKKPELPNSLEGIET